MAYIIRRGTAEDADGIARVKRLAWADEDTGAGYIAGVLAGEGVREASVAVLAEEVVGFVDGFLTTSAKGVRRWELDLIAVSPVGRRKGIAYALTCAAVESGRAHRAQVIRALTHEDNTPIFRTLEKAGFVCAPALLLLHVAQAEISPVDCTPAGHVIPVVTLGYRGVWLEDVFTPESLRYARQAAERGEIAGALIPALAVDALRLAGEQGYECVGGYYWWSLTLT